MITYVVCRLIVLLHNIGFIASWAMDPKQKGKIRITIKG